MNDILQLITDLRGGQPQTCSFCGKVRADLQPEEAGQWICSDCLAEDLRCLAEEKKRLDQQADQNDTL